MNQSYKKIGGILLAVIAAWSILWFLAPKQGFDEGDQRDETPAIDVLYENMHAYEDENITRVRETLHPNAPLRETSLVQTEQLFRRFDLSLELSNVTVVSRNSTAVRIKATQTTRASESAQYRDNRVVGLHTLRKYQGTWRIYSTEIKSVEYLE